MRVVQSLSLCKIQLCSGLISYYFADGFVFFLFQNNWVPRGSADSGPKTLEQVHDEARREEMANRLQREQVSL